MEKEQGLSEIIKGTKLYQRIKQNPILFNLLRFFINDVIIRTAKDLLDDGKLNGSAK